MSISFEIHNNKSLWSNSPGKSKDARIYFKGGANVIINEFEALELMRYLERYIELNRNLRN